MDGIARDGRDRWCRLFNPSPRHPCRNKKSLNSKNDDLQGNTETHCVQTTVFLILKVVIFCPTDRLVSKSFVKHTALRRLLISSVLPRHPRQNKNSFSSCAASCKGNTETRCAQTTVFLILPAGLAGPADRFARKSFAADARRGRGCQSAKRDAYLAKGRWREATVGLLFPSSDIP